MHHQAVSTNYEWLPHNVHPARNPTPPAYQDMVVQPLGDRQREADDFLAGCVDFYGIKGHRCLSNEKTRVAMNLRQPKSVSNYTSTGFVKMRAPTEVFAHIKKFWDANREKGKPESWNTGNIYVNHWESPSLMVSVEDSALEFGGGRLKSKIWEAARETVSAWTGQQLAECSLYGIRIYHEGAMLAPHVDRLPLVASVIINVDQDVDEPWPLEVIGHDGKAHNITMVPGDMILYESHSIIHSRPFALQGRFMANVFM
jgi:prolyl 4-hydroxylase